MTVAVRSSVAVPRSTAQTVTVPWRIGHARRWSRYAITSVVATAVSEATLLTMYGLHLMAASQAAVFASLAGVIPSYAMSRYWIWPEADRRRPAQQAIAYWVVALVSLGVSSLVTGIAAAHAPAGQAAHLVVVGLAYIATYGGLWILKFVVYQRFLFRPSRAASMRELMSSSIESH